MNSRYSGNMVFVKLNLSTNKWDVQVEVEEVSTTFQLKPAGYIEDSRDFQFILYKDNHPGIPYFDMEATINSNGLVVRCRCIL